MKRHIVNLFLISVIGIIAWYPVLNFWFFKGYEASWLMSFVPHSFINLLRSHSFLYYIDWKIFGWNPWGWYLTSIVLHVCATFLFYIFLLLITKNGALSLISSTIFVASTSYNDVLTSGSRNSYYSLLLVIIILVLMTFYKYRLRGRYYFLILSLIFTVSAIIVRETGIVIVFILTGFDFFLTKKLGEKMMVGPVIKRMLPYYVLIIIFFILRSKYGGTIGDIDDGNVKLQIKLVQDGMFVEYAKVFFLTFGKLLPPTIIPYPLLNTLRELSYTIGSRQIIDTYFFPVLGWVIFISSGAYIYFLRGKNNYFWLLLFFWFWVGAYLSFVSLTVPNTADVLALSYQWDTMRYRYFSFVGISVIVSIILIIFYKKIQSKNRLIKIFFFAFCLGCYSTNILLLRKIQNEIYINTYKPAKDFYTKFKTKIPIMPDNYYIYYYPYTPGLNDYLGEWCRIKEYIHPGSKNLPCFFTDRIEKIIMLVKNNKVALGDVYFFDLNEKGLINNTMKAQTVLKEEREYSLDFKRDEIGSVRWTTKPMEGPYVEVPYNLELALSSKLLDFNIRGERPDKARFKALVDYIVGQKEFLNSVKIRTSITMGGDDKTPFLHLLPKNLIDGNTGMRSSWITRKTPGWIEADFGAEKELYGIIWGSSPSSVRIPSTYRIYSSNNARDWSLVKEIKNNKKHSNIDVFKKAINARYIKMVIHTTSGGDFVLIDEFEVVGSKGKDILKLYDEREKLISDSRDIFKFLTSQQDINYARQKGLNFYLGRLSWETNKTISSENNQSLIFPYFFSKQEEVVKIELPESEVFSAAGQFLEKKITRLSIDFGKGPINVDVHSVKLVPRYKFSKKIN